MFHNESKLKHGFGVSYYFTHHQLYFRTINWSCHVGGNQPCSTLEFDASLQQKTPVLHWRAWDTVLLGDEAVGRSCSSHPHPSPSHLSVRPLPLHKSASPGEAEGSAQHVGSENLSKLTPTGTSWPTLRLLADIIAVIAAHLVSWYLIWVNAWWDSYSKFNPCPMWLIEGLTMWDIHWWRCLFLCTIHAKNASQSTTLPNHGGWNIGYSILIFCSRVNCQRTDLLEQWNLPWTINVFNYVRKQVRQFARTVISFQNTRKVQIHPQPCSRFDTETCAYWLYSKSNANEHIYCQHMLSSIHYCYGKVQLSC